MNKKLYKSTKNKVLTGVCGGLGEYFNFDATIIRLIFAVTLIFGGMGLVVYIIATVVIPSKPIENFEDFDNLKSANPKDEKKSSPDDDFDSYFKK